MPERGQERPGQVPTLPRWPAQGQETGNWLVSGSEAGKSHATYYQVVPIISTLIGVRQAIRMKLFHVVVSFIIEPISVVARPFVAPSLDPLSSF